MAPSLVYEYSHLNPDGIDHHLFSKLCSNRMTNYSAFPRYQDIHDSGWKEGLPKYISSIIYRSNFGVSIAVAALILVERFQDALLLRQACSADEGGDADRLFLIAYMVAAKIINDEQPRMKFWETVAKDQYSWRDLARMERQFYDVLGWKVQIDGESFDRCFVRMMDAYHCYLERHELPSAPPPVYQKVHKNETARMPVAVIFQTEDRRLIPTLDEEDEASFAKPLLSPRARLAAQWSKYRWQLFGIVLRPPVPVHDHEKQDPYLIRC